MSLTTLIIDGVLLAAMIGVSLYGMAALPADAQIPVHFGPTGYNRWVSKNAGLVMWPGLGLLVYVVLIVATRGQGAKGGSGPTIGLTVALGVMLVTHVGALAVARARSRR